MNALYKVEPITCVTINGVKHDVSPEVGELLLLVSEERDELRMVLHQILQGPSSEMIH